MPAWEWHNAVSGLPVLACLAGAAWVGANLTRCGRGGAFAVVGLVLLGLTHAYRAFCHAGGSDALFTMAYRAGGPSWYHRVFPVLDACRVAGLLGSVVGGGLLVAAVMLGRSPRGGRG